MSLITLQNYLGGKLQGPVNGHYLDNHEPATGGIYARTPASDEQDLEAAVKAAQAAFPRWSTLPAEHKSQHLCRLADLIEQHQDELAAAEARDNGKPQRFRARSHSGALVLWGPKNHVGRYGIHMGRCPQNFGVEQFV